MSEICKSLWRKLYSDKGYLSKRLQNELTSNDINFITRKRRKMKPNTIKLWDKLMLIKRFIIETVFDQLKNISQIEHTRHRSCVSFMVNLIAELIAYSFQKKKPSIKVTRLDKRFIMQFRG